MIPIGQRRVREDKRSGKKKFFFEKDVDPLLDTATTMFLVATKRRHSKLTVVPDIQFHWIPHLFLCRC